jgi:hypothetical protein
LRTKEEIPQQLTDVGCAVFGAILLSPLQLQFLLVIGGNILRTDFKKRKKRKEKLIFELKERKKKRKEKKKEHILGMGGSRVYPNRPVSRPDGSRVRIHCYPARVNFYPARPGPGRARPVPRSAGPVRVLPGNRL